MQREWLPEDLIAWWTLIGDDWQLLGNKTGALVDLLIGSVHKINALRRSAGGARVDR